MAAKQPPVVDLPSVVRLWLARQGLVRPGTTPFERAALVDHLERTGALQLDSINVLDRAHYLTLWSRFGAYDRRTLDRWIYRDRVAYEYWGHEASILPISHLPLGRCRMRRFPPPSWLKKTWWPIYSTSTASKRRVLRRLKAEGPLEGADFERQPGEARSDGTPGGSMLLQKEDGRSLKLLWHAGRTAIYERRSFRSVYDLAERVYPEGPTATLAQLEDSWLLTGLSGNGIASEAHLTNYLTAPAPNAAERKRIIARNLKRGTIVEVRVEGRRGSFFALPPHLDEISALPEPAGTTLLCPFDSLLWQRKRAAELLGFDYRVEIYVPPPKRRFGYYVLPILHDGRLVGRLDPKLHRDRSALEVRSVHLESSFEGHHRFFAELRDALESLARFTGASDIEVPRSWRHRLA